MYIEYTEKELEILKSKDERLALAIEKIGYIKREKDSDIFSSVVHKIVGQQISMAAQETIWKRFNDKLGIISPATILVKTAEELRNLGISYRKLEYIKDFALKVNNKSFDIDLLPTLDDEALKAELVKLKGVGPWTAEMLMIFALGRKNILSYDDLGIRRGIKILYGLEKLDKKDFEKYKNIYSPYGTIASFYLWEISNGALGKLENLDNKEKLTNVGRKAMKKNKTNKESKKSKAQNFGIYKSKIGYIKITEEAGKILAIKIIDNQEYKSISLENANKNKSQNLNTELIDIAYKQISEYLDGKRKEFDFEICLKGTDFQKKVWTALLEIPYGEIRTYKDIAIKIQNPNASRAVGMANNKNPLLIVVPCHRVIGSNGKLTGYAAGLDIKKELLNLENRLDY